MGFSIPRRNSEEKNSSQHSKMEDLAELTSLSSSSSSSSASSSTSEGSHSSDSEASCTSDGPLSPILSDSLSTFQSISPVSPPTRWSEPSTVFRHRKRIIGNTLFQSESAGFRRRKRQTSKSETTSSLSSSTPPPLQPASSSTARILSHWGKSALVLGLLVTVISRYSIRTTDAELAEILSIRRGTHNQVQGIENDLRRLHNELSTLDDIMLEYNNKLIEHGDNGGGGGGVVDDNNVFGSGSYFHTAMMNSDSNPKEILARHVYSSEMNEYKRVQQHVKDLGKNAEHLRAQIQESSRKQIVHKFGSGTHRVEIELAFPGNHADGGGPNRFVIEMASIETMPHSVHLFLEMVSGGLLDGCSFILNALHVLKAAPLPYDGSSAADKAGAFMKAGLESVAFKEYDETHPHKPYTVGFAADGSPSFFINTEDNTDIYHGEPCFGKIISGFDTVRRMEESPVRNGIWLEKRIGIKHARVLSIHAI